MRHHALRACSILCLILVVGPAWADAPRRVTQADLLGRLIDVQRLCMPATPGETPGLISGITPIPKHAGEWRGLARLEGPGAITRFWFDNCGGAIRIVVDGRQIVETPLAELLSGQTEPFLPPLITVPAPTTSSATPAACRGVSSYVPIGFTKGCEILVKDASSLFEISHVRFDKRVEVEPFTIPLGDEAKTAAQRISKALQSGLSDRDLYGEQRPMPVAAQQDLGPDDTLIETLDGDGTLRSLYVALTDKSDPREPYALHRMILRVFVDGSKEPSVEAPLSALFGSGYELEYFNAVGFGTYKDLRVPIPDRPLGRDRFMYIVFPMPYREGLRIEIENRGKRKKPTGILMIAHVDTRTPAEGAMRLHARYRSENPSKGDTFTLLEAAGAGRIVGCTLLADIPRRDTWATMPLELRLDDADFAGTGGGLLGARADGAVPCAYAFNGVARTGPYGKSTGYRLFIADALDFQKSARLALRNAPAGGPRDVFLGAVVYWYGAAPGPGVFSRLTDAELRVPGFRLPNTIEIEGNVRTTGWGNTVKEEFTGVELSGGVAASVSLESPVEINIPSDQARTVRLSLRAVPGRPFEKISIVDAAGKPLKTIEYARVPDGIFEVGMVSLKAGDNLFRLECSRPALLDCWILDEP